MSETTVPMDDAALFSGAIATEAPAEAAPAATEAPAQEAQTEQQPEDTGQPRDEHGRFAPKAEEKAEATAEAEATPADQQQPKDNAAQIPAWRVSEITEARRAAEARAADNERRAQQLELQTRQLSEQLRKFTEQPQDPVDPYADPEKFRDQGVRQAIDPIRAEIGQIREHYSRENAIRVYGEDTVKEAYNWLQQASAQGDPRAAPVLQRALNSIDPFKDIVTAFKRDKALSTVGDDPNAWFEQEAKRRAAADPQWYAKLQQPAQAQNGSSQPSNIVKLPPSLSKVSGAADNSAAGSMADADLYAFAKT